LRVIAVDANPAKLDLALAWGAHATCTPAEAVGNGVQGDVVIEAAGAVPAFESAVTLTAPGGRTVTVGLPAPGAMARVSPLSLVAQGRTIVGSYLGSSVPSRDIPQPSGDRQLRPSMVPPWTTT
jgi:alcohol dehydrogenase